MPRTHLSTAVNIISAFEKMVERFPGKPSIHFKDRSISFSQLKAEMDRFSVALGELGIQRNDRLAIYAPNSIETIITFLGAVRAGCIVTILHPALKASDVQYILEDAGVRILVTDPHQVETIQSIKSKLPDLERVIIYGENVGEGLLSYPTLMAETSQQLSIDNSNRSTIMLLIYTSGTTGKRKGALHTHGSILENTIAVANWGKIGPDDQSTCNFPISSVGGILTSVLLPLLVGSTCFLMERFTAEEAAELTTRHQISWFFGVPTMFWYLLDLPQKENYDFSSYRLCLVAGAPVPEELFRAFNKRYGHEILESYGSTEGQSITLTQPGKARISSCGHPNPGVELRIVDDADENLPIGEIGEILIRSPQMMKGYWNNQEATESVFRGGWLHTGDMGRLDDDGYLYVVDRKDDMFISRGHNIYPKEVENILYDHPKIKYVAVIGAQHPTWGAIPKAIVVLNEGEIATEEEILTYCKERITAYKSPKVVEFRHSLPISGTGKVLKNQLKRESYQE